MVRGKMVKKLSVTQVDGYALNEYKEMEKVSIDIPYSFKSQEALERYIHNNIDRSFAVVAWESYDRKYEMKIDDFIKYATPIPLRVEDANGNAPERR